MTTAASDVITFFRAMLTDKVRLEFDVNANPQRRRNFEAEYRRITGIRPRLNRDHYRVASNKYSEQYRVYLDLGAAQRAAVRQFLRRHGIRLEDTAAQYQHRHYNYRFSVPTRDPHLFWELVECGFR